MEIEELLQHASSVVNNAKRQCILAHIAICETDFFIYSTSKDLI